MSYVDLHDTRRVEAPVQEHADHEPFGLNGDEGEGRASGHDDHAPQRFDVDIHGQRPDQGVERLPQHLGAAGEMIVNADVPCQWS